MARVDEHRAVLRDLPADAWDDHLATHSGLPGPRGNLELLAAVVEEATPDRLWRYARSADEYQASCGASGLGRLAAEGDTAARAGLRALAADARWRVREGVAMGLQRLGDVDREALAEVVTEWATDASPLVRRAAIAGICEPRLLDRATARTAVAVLDRVTASLLAIEPSDRRGNDDLRVLRQALGYCWSVAVAALPAEGFAAFERWASVDDRDIRWVVRENLGKKRLIATDPERVAGLRTRLGS